MGRNVLANSSIRINAEWEKRSKEKKIENRIPTPDVEGTKVLLHQCRHADASTGRISSIDFQLLWLSFRLVCSKLETQYNQF